jgi:1-acyl-sn-glycerol-3-phosphate acyltransferase
MLRRILQPFYTAYVAVTFTASVLIIFPFFLIIGVWDSLGARRTIFYIVKYWSDAWLWLIGMPLTKIGKGKPNGRYVVVANHISYLDTINIFSAAHGYFRPLGKKEISAIPVIGFIYKQIVIMVDRSSLHSRARSMRLMWRVLHREGSIAIFPEGTFNEGEAPLKSFYDGAFRLAISTQTPILPVIFPDTVRRWHFSAWWKLWPGRNRIVYMEPVEVKGLTAQDAHALRDEVYRMMENELKKYMPQARSLATAIA